MGTSSAAGVVDLDAIMTRQQFAAALTAVRQSAGPDRA
jgi:hypothetical protein